MGAKLGGDDDSVIADINVTPLVDIVLVLLIIFMLTANLINQPAIKVDLPKAANPDDSPSSSLSLILSKDNQLYINGELRSIEYLDTFVPTELKTHPELMALIQADKECSHGRVIELIDRIKGLGVSKFALNIEQTQINAPPLPQAITPATSP
jgi:biopolymer transport protein TolR